MTVSPQWWADGVGYQVYVPSFQDSNGDGWGDLPGVTSRLGYLADLGVTIVWLSPIHPSPFAEHGYDVSDYRAVNSRFGTLHDLQTLLSEARDRGLRVLMDLVPNHTSEEHEWFRRARTDRHSRYRDFYIWRDPAPGGGPPNNWVSRFGGSAWAWDEEAGQYYLHLFAASQPDLNWRNPAVAEEFDSIMSGWLDLGFSGFRVDVPHVVLKHPDLPDNPVVPEDQVITDVRGSREWWRFQHRYDMDQPDLLDLYARWRAVTAPRGRCCSARLTSPIPGAWPGTPQAAAWTRCSGSGSLNTAGNRIASPSGRERP
jgi:alpha-glucosidase